MGIVELPKAPTLAAIDLGPPAFVALVRDGMEWPIDVYAARRMLEQAQKEAAGDEAKFNDAVLCWLAGQTGCIRCDMAESMAIQFTECVCAIVTRLDAERKKKVTSTVASLGSTPASQATTETGQ